MGITTTGGPEISSAPNPHAIEAFPYYYCHKCYSRNKHEIFGDNNLVTRSCSILPDGTFECIQLTFCLTGYGRGVRISAFQDDFLLVYTNLVAMYDGHLITQDQWISQMFDLIMYVLRRLNINGLRAKHVKNKISENLEPDHLNYKHVNMRCSGLEMRW